MSDTQTARIAESPALESRFGHGVKILLTNVEGADLDAAISVVARQVYEPTPQLVLVGVDAGSVPDGVTVEASLENAIASAGSDVDYIWILHADARPRPDALGALVGELERGQAALAGSKLLVAGTENELESVGSATDVFGEPYTGLDEGEIDLQQYDVVREVAFVPSASMLVRRDLAQGLRGLDPLLPPTAAGLDFSQRTRLAGGRVISVPSSEVYHQGRCGEGIRDWREQAGQLRSMLTAYSPLTLLWVIPFDFIVSLVDSIGSLLLLRWRPAAAHLRSWLWNVAHLPSTLRQRRRFRAVRAEPDEELFRFQARGSILLRETGSELSGRLLSVFDDDQALARGTRRVWSSPGIWGAFVAAAIALFAARSIFLGSVPNTGFSFPFEPPTMALQRWAGGWNDAGLGSSSPVHPSVGLTGALSWLWFGAEGSARAILTVAVGLIGVAGLGRLAGRMGLRGPGRYLAGLVLLAGPGTAALAGRGSWLSLAAAAVLPWTVRASLTERRPGARVPLKLAGWAVGLGVPLAALSPALSVVPLLTVLIWNWLGGAGGRLSLAAASLGGAVVAVPFLVADPGWLVDPRRSLGLVPDVLWVALLAVTVIAVWLLDELPRRVGLVGGVLSVGGLALARLVPMGPGLEEAVLVLASFGAALLVAGGLETVSGDARRLAAAVATSGILILSVVSFGNGRLGLPAGDLDSRLGFARTLSEEADPGRILVVSASRSDIPGEARPGPGFWYRLVDGSGMTHDEVWLPSPVLGDRALERAVEEVSAGTLRPGEALAEFSVSWVMLLGDELAMDESLAAQLDLAPTPLDTEARVFENPSALPMAAAGDEPWNAVGTGFEGEAAADRVRLGVNYHPGWIPDGAQDDWATTVSASTGVASFNPTPLGLWTAIATAALLVVAIGLVVVGRKSP